MKKKFFLNKTVAALSEKQIADLDSIFGGVADIPIDDIIHYPTGGGGPRCPDGYYWHEGTARCIRDGEYPYEEAKQTTTREHA
ncbi:hypothetical protein KORDIASMS9_04289 [Kordia sp. SMS9]|uniref:hypothetical protein n=1 Tax=Kordia sp. SMS9 TaxID=2282170 RepID=UPI000E0D869E|nr:hypothetical protein [Kordia sp. SMS9]AXG72027.1 hypothetical protein KORDIASMS9_04289 [Kordia sp. SMS9]